jgi:hypothetical protein
VNVVACADLLCSIEPEAGFGLVLFHPKGALLRIIGQVLRRIEQTKQSGAHWQVRKEWAIIPNQPAPERPLPSSFQVFCPCV